MGMMYAWANKEYLLWNMTIGQIVMYLNKGIEIKYGTKSDDGLSKGKINELKKIRDQMREEEQKALENNADVKKELRRKYGEIE